VSELRKAGFQVDHVSDLFIRPLNYKEAIPILLHRLPTVEDHALKQEIVRALAVLWARPQAARPLIHEFVNSPDQRPNGLRWTMGNALSVVATDDVFDDIVSLFRNKEYGRTREMLALALARMKNPRAVDALIESLDDEEVAGHAVMALRKMNAKKAESAMRPFTEHPKTWIRNEAKRALEKMKK